jgi:hypothetical protein
MTLYSRADLESFADAEFTTNGNGEITGADLNDGYKRAVDSALIRNESGDIGAGLAWSSDALRIAVAGVTLAMLENRAQATLIGRASGAGTGVPTELTASQVKTLLAIAAGDVSGLAAIATSGSASDLSTGTLPIARIADADVTLAKLANLAKTTLFGRAAAAGTGVPSALSASQVSTILGLAAIATSGSASDLSIGTVPNARVSGSYTNFVAIQMSDDLFMTAVNALIRKATIDGADSGSISLVGGGTVSSTRGASVGVFGNEHGVNPGNLLLQAGDTGVIKLNGTAVSAFATSTDLANATGTLNIARIADGDVTLAKLANLAQATIIGRAAAAGTGVPTALTATQVKTLLAIAAGDVSGLAAIATSGSASDLGTGTLPIARIADGAVTLAKLANLAQATIIGRASGAGTGVPTALVASDLSTILGLAAVATSGSASDLGIGTLPIARIADAAVTLAKMANLAQSTIIGRAAAAGTGVPTALTATQVKTLLAIAISDVASLQSSLDAKVALAGDTMTGALSINMATPLFTLDATASGQTKAIRWRTNGSTRWQLQANNTAESGSDAGSNMSFTRFDDSGVVIAGAPLLISRASGEATFIATAAAAATYVFNNNATSGAGVEVRLDLSPGNGLANVRSAYIAAINEGANTIRLAFGGSAASGAAPVERMFLKSGLVVGASLTDQGAGSVNADGGYFYKNNKLPDFQTSASNGNMTVTCVSPITTFVSTGTLTADRTLTVPTTNAVAGWLLFLKRTGGDTGGPWQINVNSGLTFMPTGTNKLLLFNGSAWILIY